MTPPNRLPPSGGAIDAPRPLSPAQERDENLQLANFLLDPGNSEDPEHYARLWNSDRDYRLSHGWVTDFIDALTRFMKRDSRMSASKFEELLQSWLKERASDPLGAVLIVNARRVLRQFQTDDNGARAKVAMKLLPPEPAPPKPVPSEGWVEKPKRLVVGFELENDTVPYAALDFIGLPLSGLATEQSKFTLKTSMEFPVGDWTGMARLGGGVFSAKNIPGSGSGDVNGSGYRVALDFGWVDPSAKSHDRAGFGLELTGVSSHGGEAIGVATPSPVVRLHLFRESDLNWDLGNDWELGVSLPLMHEESYFILGGDTSLIPTDSTSPLSSTGSLFAKSPMRMFGISARYYVEGSPGRESVEDQEKPFRPGEGGPKLAQLWTGQLINLNRREAIPAFSNTLVLFGTFWPQGMEESRRQFDTITTGLTLYSAQDGWTMAKNARLRSEIWRRDKDWLNKGLMLGADAIWMGYHFFQTVAAENDPPSNQTLEEFQQNPGSVRDFQGRVGRMSLPLGAVELGLSALDASGYAGREGDADSTRFTATSYVVAGIGLAGVLFSGPLSGNGCAESGLLRCGFPGNKDKYFKGGIDADPGHMRAIENQYIVSTSGAALASWGLSRVLTQTLFGKKDSSKVGEPRQANKTPAKLQSAGITDPYLQVSLTDEGGQFVLGGRF